jgi:hypothetical protein
MTARPDEAQRLRDLHDRYVRKVNAAVREGREDLIRSLVDDHLEEAMRTMIDAHPSPCERAGCRICARPRRAAPTRRGWLGWLRP